MANNFSHGGGGFLSLPIRVASLLRETLLRGAQEADGVLIRRSCGQGQRQARQRR